LDYSVVSPTDPTSSKPSGCLTQSAASPPRGSPTYDLPISVRGGGHDWAGRAMRPGGLVIDLTGMHQVAVDIAGLGGGADATVGGRNDRCCVDDPAGRVPVRWSRRVPSLEFIGGGQRGEPGRQCGCRGADDDRPGDSGVAIVRADRVL